MEIQGVLKNSIATPTIMPARVITMTMFIIEFYLLVIQAEPIISLK